MNYLIRIFYLCIAIQLAFGTAVVAQPNKPLNTDTRLIKLMTYNLKFASPDFKPTWDERREMQVKLIRKYNPDIIGTQEGLKEQIDWLADNLPDCLRKR